MPEYLTASNLTWLTILWPLLLFNIILSLVIWLPVSRHANEGDKQRMFWYMFGFSSLGMTVGLLTGDSGSSVVASVLPAVLSLVGGLGAIFLTRQVEQALVIAVCISIMSISLLLGALIGMENRRIEEGKQTASIHAQSELGDLSDLSAQINAKLKAGDAH